MLNRPTFGVHIIQIKGFLHTAILLAGFEVSLIDDKVPHSVPVAEIPYPTEEQNEQPEREFREELQRLLLP